MAPGAAMGGIIERLTEAQQETAPEGGRCVSSIVAGYAAVAPGTYARPQRPQRRTGRSFRLRILTVWRAPQWGHAVTSLGW